MLMQACLCLQAALINVVKIPEHLSISETVLTRDCDGLALVLLNPSKSSVKSNLPST